MVYKPWLLLKMALFLLQEENFFVLVFIGSTQLRLFVVVVSLITDHKVFAIYLCIATQ